jgi:hypothetical protein
MLISLKTRTNSGGIPFRKHTAHALSKFIKGFQAFLRKRREKDLFKTSQCSPVRNNLCFFVLVYLIFILLSYSIDQAFIMAHFRPKKLWACLCTQLYLVLYWVQRQQRMLTLHGRLNSEHTRPFWNGYGIGRVVTIREIGYY